MVNIPKRQQILRDDKQVYLSKDSTKSKYGEILSYLLNDYADSTFWVNYGRWYTLSRVY